MQSENLRGALLMMLAMALFTVSDTIMKLLGGTMPIFQTLLWRGLVVCLILGVLAWRARAFAARLPRQDTVMIAARAVTDAASTWFFLQALYHMPIANLTAIMQALPLTVTLAAALFLREPVGWRRMLAIGIGFTGILLIVRPGAEGFDRYAVYALIVVVMVTLRELSTRRMSRAVPSLRAAFWSMLAITAMGAIGTVTEPIVTPDGVTMTLFVATALCIVAASLLIVMATRTGELGFVTPFRYTGLIWALILGYAVFGDWPRPLTFLGAALVVGTGMFTLYRERRAKLRALRPR